MEETLVSERHERNRDDFVIKPMLTSRRVAPSVLPILTESSQPVLQGDRIHALPYWSERTQFTAPDTPSTLWSHMGDVYPGEFGGATNGDATDWPMPRFRGGEMNRGTWTFNATQFLQYPPLALPTGSNAEWASLVRLADTKALGNLRKGLVNLPLIMAERRETLGMICGKVALMAKGANALQDRSLKELKKISPRNRKEAARRIANQHLEFVFGWLPIIDEIEGLADFIQKDQLDFVRSRGVQAFVTSVNLQSATSMVPGWAQHNYFSGGNPYGLMVTSGTSLQIISVRTALRYRLSSAVVGNLYDLGFDPVGAAFDLVPLSFITGWISNFDYWIRTLTPAFGLEFETGSRNRRRKTVLAADGRFIPVKTGRYHCVGKVASPSAKGYIQRDEREVLHAPPDATLDWDVDVGLYEVAAGASLLIQRYIKPLRRAIKVRAFRYKGPRPKWLDEIRYTGRI